MKADENLLLVSLNPTDTEYKSVLADFTQTLGRNPTIHKVIVSFVDFSGSNIDGSFTTAVSNSFLSPLEKVT